MFVQIERLIQNNKRSYVWFATLEHCICAYSRRGWCCSCEGELLLFMIEELVANLHLVSDVSLSYDQRTDIEHALEQSIYCLYSHPNKRGKAKHLDEHNTTQVNRNLMATSKDYKTFYLLNTQICTNTIYIF